MGVLVWPMVEFEADDALAAAAWKSALDSRVGKVIICTPDKDLGQCVVGTRVVQLDRRREIIRDEAGVIDKFGVKPESIPDYLGLVGDTADGYPGLPGWGAKAAAAVLSRYPHLEDIPKDANEWHPSICNKGKLATTLFSEWNEAILFRTLARLRLDVPVFDTVDDLRWHGPREGFEQVCTSMKAQDLFRRTASANLKSKQTT
jgi:5'-3' exonuclease